MKQNEHLAAEELDVFLTARGTGQAEPLPAGIDPEDANLAANLAFLAETIRLNPAFVAELESRLLYAIQASQPPVDRSFWPSIVESMAEKKQAVLKRTKLSYVAGFVVLLSVLVTLPALAQMALEHFAPREVATLPVPGPVAHEPSPAPPRFMDLEQLENLAGFSLLVPEYLPPSCRLMERFYASVPREVILHYSCALLIAEKRGNSIDRPFVGEGSTHEVTVGGNPAIYIDGVWTSFSDSDQEEPIWIQGTFHQLVFERNGLVIRMDAPSSRLTKEELIRIAESLE